jgi:D-alanyl-D-alanine carboxypeptidase
MNLIFSENDFQGLEAFIEKLSAEDKFSGSVLVAKNGVVLFKEAYGLASKGYNIKNKVDTKYNLGSMNKMFTGVSIVKLVEMGLIKLDDYVGKYLPHYPPEIADKITIHQLLTHTSGLGSYWNEKYKASISRIKSVEDYTHLFINDPLLFEPGERWEYSNAGYIVLGAIIESVTEMSYFEFVKETIYSLADMPSSDSYDLEFDVPNLAIGYTREGVETEGIWRNNLFLHVVKGGPAGGGYSTVQDLLNFGIAIRNNKLLNAEHTELVTRGKFEQSGDAINYGYGFMDVTTSGERIIGHNGGFPGISSTLNMYMNSGYTLVILSNYDNGAMIVQQKFNELLFHTNNG